jgi:hypothetical protein
MKTRAFRLCLAVVLGGLWAGCLAAQTKSAAPATPAAPASGVEARLQTYMLQFLSFDPASKVTVEKAPEKLAGFQSYKIKRTGKYAKLNVDKTVWVSEDGKWFFDGEMLTNPNPKPVQTALDLMWLEKRTSDLYRTRAKAFLVPERDAGGLKAVGIAVESGFGPVRVPGYVTPDGTRYLGGMLWDFQMDPREERKKRIDLSQGRFEGKPDGKIMMAEYADMECGYCRYRGLQMDALLAANPGLSYKRYYKFFPLWFSHAWSMKAASAADCIWRFAKQQMFEFKKQVYAQQAVMTVSGIDELALTFAEAAGIPKADFLNCYLRDDSLADVRKDLEEGQRLGVKSTPTYYVDGTEITWIEDKVMEDFLRTKDPNIKTIEYVKP